LPVAARRANRRGKLPGFLLVFFFEAISDMHPASDGGVARL
jgi:hypothetical protein